MQLQRKRANHPEGQNGRAENVMYEAKIKTSNVNKLYMFQ